MRRIVLPGQAHERIDEPLVVEPVHANDQAVLDLKHEASRPFEDLARPPVLVLECDLRANDVILDAVDGRLVLDRKSVV